jgi:hypothetical protein
MGNGWMSTRQQKDPPAYRCYLLDERGGIIRARELICENDDQAVQAALAWFALQENQNGARFEIWDRARLVARGGRQASTADV